MTEQTHGHTDRRDYGGDILSIRLDRVLITVTARFASAGSRETFAIVSWCTRRPSRIERRTR